MASPWSEPVAMVLTRFAARAGFLLVFAGVSLGAHTPSAVTGDPFTDLELIRPPQRKAAPDFTVPRLPTGSVALKELRASVVFLNFWATWCPPCKEEMPSMERLYRAHKERGFVVLAISIDADTAPVAAFVKKLGLTFPIGLDPKLEVANRFTVRALPSSFLIDRDANTVAVALGPRAWDGTAAHAVVESLLK